MPNMNTLLSKIDEAEANNLLTKRNKRNSNINKAFSTLTIIAGLSMVVNIGYQQQTDLIEYQTHQINKNKPLLRYKERTRRDLSMNLHKNNDELSNVMKNLNANPFYKKSNMDLLEKVNIKGHLQSKTPYIPIGSLKIKDAHLLKGDSKI